jgi:hypothetical protein
MAHCKTSFESREALNVNGTRLRPVASRFFLWFFGVVSGAE